MCERDTEGYIMSAEKWGLPAGFEPVRFEVTDQVKEVMRDILHAGEPVIVSLTNRSASLTALATPQRFFSVKTGDLNGVGVTGCVVKEYPWQGINRLVAQQAADTLRIAVHYRTINGRSVEVGRRAAMGKDAVDHLTPFDWNQGSIAFAAIETVWRAMSPSSS